MSLLVPINGQNYIIPETNEVGWGSNLDDFFVAISAGTLQKTGGSFTLSAETDFGSSYGLKSLYYKSRSSNIAASGILRLNNNSDAVTWRNAANDGDLALKVNASNQLSFNGTPIQPSTLNSAHILVGNSSNIATDVAMSGNIAIDNTGATTIQAGVIVNSMVNASAAIAYSKLNLTGSIVNADVNASAAIAYSKLNLSASIVNADVNASAAIAYSKLNLTGGIVNADVNASAAIAYSKLALTGSIVNADISSSAAIGITKIANGTANQVLGTNAGASANEWKTLTATANQVSVTHGVGTVTFATPQDIGTASAVRFGSLTLGGALDASAILSLTSTTKGFLPPSMTTTQKNAITSPTDGLIVYDASLAQLFLRASGSWTPLSVGGGSGTVASGTQYQLGYYAAGGTTLSGLTLITGSRALASDANGLPVASATTATELGYVNGVTSAIQTQMNLKAPLAGPTFTGTVTIPTPFTLGAVSVTATGTELNYVAGVTSAIQTQLNLLAPKASPAFTGTVLLGPASSRTAVGSTFGVEIEGITGPTSGLSIVRNTADAGNPNLVFGKSRGTTTGSSTIVQNGDGLGNIYFAGADGTNMSTPGVSIEVLVDGTPGAGVIPGKILFRTATSGGTLTTAMTIDATQKATHNGNIAFAATSTQGIVGTTTNDNAAAGNVGETVLGNQTTLTNFPTSTQWGDLTSISLTAGDWLVWGVFNAEANGTMTECQIAVTSTSGNSTTGFTNGLNNFLYRAASLTGTNFIQLNVPAVRFSLSAGATVYLKYEAVYSSTAPQAYGNIRALRIR